MELKVKIDGMLCEHCKNRVEKALQSLKNVNCKVILEEKYAYLSSSKDIDEKKIRQLISNAGYTVISIEEI